MKQSQLLLFEGAPGSGKSSLSQFVAQQLQAADTRVHWLEEHALNEQVFGPFFDALEQPNADLIAVLLDCWRTFCAQIASGTAIYCVDGAFFHSTLKLLLAYRASEVSIADYLQSLYQLLRPFQPRLVLLMGDTAAIMQAAIDERGARWAANVAADVAEYPIQQSQPSDVASMIAFFVESQRQLVRYAADFPFAQLHLDTTARDWTAYQREVCAWLDLPIRFEERSVELVLEQYVGIYQPPAHFPPEFNHPLEVELTADGLRLHTVFLRNFRLTALQHDRFALAGRPLTLEFVRDDLGILVGAIYPFVPEQRFLCTKIV